MALVETDLEVIPVAMRINAGETKGAGENVL